MAGVPAPGARAAAAAAALGPALCTYTAVLLADTAIPAWHEARRELPFLFASGAAMSAGPRRPRRSTVGSRAAAGARGRGGGAGRGERWSAAWAGSVRALPQRVGGLADPGVAGTQRGGRGARGSLGLERLGDRRRSAARMGGALILLAAVCTRAGVFEAGKASARDPKYTVIPQRQRLEEGRGHRQHEQVER